MLRLRFTILLGLISGALLLPSSALATSATVHFFIVNQQGIPQVGASMIMPQDPTCTYELGNGGLANCYPWGPSGYRTDSSGKTTFPGVDPGDTLYASRAESSLAGNPLVASILMPDPLPQEQTMVVPTLATPYEPQLSDRERRIIGLINDQRQALGRPRLQVSTVLNHAADGYLEHLPYPSDIPAGVDPHFAFATPSSRMIDSGWPMLPGAWHIAENIAWFPTASEAFTGWMNSTGHRENMLNSKFNAVGIGSRDCKWVLELAEVEPSLTPAAQLTSDTGDSGSADQAGQNCGAISGPAAKPGSKSETDSRARPQLRFARVQVHGRQLAVVLDLDKQAQGDGEITLSASRGRQHRQLPLRGLQSRARLGPGRWQLRANFTPQKASDFEHSSISRSVRVIAKHH